MAHHWRRRRLIRRLGWGVLLGLLVFTGAMGAIAVSIRRARSLQPTRPADVIIVLGAGSWKGKPNAPYCARLDHGLQLFEAGYASHIIATEKAPVARDAQRYLIDHGAPEGAVLFEDRSTTTWENLLYARQVMGEHGWRTAIVVSCPTHLFRALQMSRDLGIPAQGSGTASSPIETTRRARSEFLVRECYKLLRYKLLGP